MRYSDRPISHPNQDLLNRRGFARTLAKAIDDLFIPNASFVIGIVGKWGAGKSSVIELIVRQLRHLEMSRYAREYIQAGTAPPDLESWLEQMASSFEQVEATLNRMELQGLDLVLWERTHQEREFTRWLGSDSAARDAYTYWRIKNDAERACRNVIVRFSPWHVAGRAELAGALLSDLARASGAKLGDELRRSFASLLGRLAELLPVAGAAADRITGAAIGGFFSAGAAASSKAVERLTQGPTLEEVYSRLRDALSGLGRRKIIVLIDDLDRLTPSEATETVSIVKSLGDLPNVVYVLSYDEEILSSLVGSNLGVDGKSYLEKIIQYSVHLPLLLEGDITRLLEHEIQNTVGELDSYQKERFQWAWHSMIRHYITTPRDVRRLANTYSLAWPGLRDHTDPVDLLVLEVLRIHEPSIYNWIRTHLSELVS